MNPMLVSALAQGGIGLIQGIAGLFGRGKANKLAEQNVFPTEQMPTEVLENQAMARARANTGLSGTQYNNSLNQINQNAATAYSAAKDRRSAAGLINAIQNNTNNATNNLNVADAQARINNQNALYGVNNNVAQFKDKLFQWNQKAKYLQTAQRISQMFQGANQNISSGIDNIGAGAVNTFLPGMGGSGGQTPALGSFNAGNRVDLTGLRGGESGTFSNPNYTIDLYNLRKAYGG